MGKTETPGTTLENPVTEEQKPDLLSSRHEIDEYLHEQGAYDLFDYLLKELLTQQPEDPMDHMIKCLKTQYPLGPLKVIVYSAPGIGRHHLSKRLAEHFGLVYIGAGDLLRTKGFETDTVGFAEENLVAGLVLEQLSEANATQQGWVLDGFPRTRFQSWFLKEASVVPTHVLRLSADVDQIRARHHMIEAGELEGDLVPVEAMEQKIAMYACHTTSALEAYKEQTFVIDSSDGFEATWAEMERMVRMLPRSHGPQPPPRVVLLGPRGVGVKEHARRLAARLGTMLVDGEELQNTVERQQSSAGFQSFSGKSPKADKQLGRGRSRSDMTSSQLLSAEDPHGVVAARLRQPDCSRQGWVMCGWPKTREAAAALQEDGHLNPVRVVVLMASADTCMNRIRHLRTDTVTGKVFTYLPSSGAIRKRLQRDAEDQPAAVMARYNAFSSSIHGILEVLGTEGRCMQIPADGPPEGVFNGIVEFVERPLSIPPIDGSGAAAEVRLVAPGG